MRKSCSLCGGELGPTLKEINKPDRFELHIGIKADNYRRFWILCNQCLCAVNVNTVKNQKLLSEISGSYYQIDFAGLPIKNKYRKILSLPDIESDNYFRVKYIVESLKKFTSNCGSINRFGGNINVLDIGAGTGVFLTKLIMEAEVSNLKINATAIEPDPIAYNHLIEIDKYKVINKKFPCNELEGKIFDLITLNKIIEHVKYPHKLLENSLELLSPNKGLLYIEVPDKDTIAYCASEDNVLGALHFHLYSFSGLSRLLENCGFVVLESRKVIEPSGKITIRAICCCKEGGQWLAKTQNMKN